LLRLQRAAPLLSAQPMRVKQLTLRMGKKVRSMKKFVTLVALLSLGAASAAWAETREDVQNRLDNAATALHEIMAAPDKAFRKKCWITQSAWP